MSLLITVLLELVCALLPSSLLFWYFCTRSRDRRRGTEWLTFILGCLTVIPAVVVEFVIQGGVDHLVNPVVQGLGNAFLVAALPEEIVKLLVVVCCCLVFGKIRTPLDGLKYGALAALGFATIENVGYVLEQGFGTALLRALLSVPGHAFSGALMGYFLSGARGGVGRSILAVVTALALPVLLHGLYDSPAFVLQSGIADAYPATAALLLLMPATVLFSVITVCVLSYRLRRQEKAILDALPVVEEEEVLEALPADEAAPLLDVLPMGEEEEVPEVYPAEEDSFVGSAW